jgi:hypothetical protein
LKKIEKRLPKGNLQELAISIRTSGSDTSNMWGIPDFCQRQKWAQLNLAQLRRCAQCPGNIGYLQEIYVQVFLAP